MKKFIVLFLTLTLFIPIIACTTTNDNGLNDINDDANTVDSDCQLLNDLENNDEYLEQPTQCCSPLTGSMHYITFEEALRAASHIVVAQLVARRQFGCFQEELEFVVSERIHGTTPDRIFVYISSHHTSVLNTPHSLGRGDNMEFEYGVNYLLPLSILNTVISNFHEDGFELSSIGPFINLDSPHLSTMYGEPLSYHATSIDFSSRSLESDEVIFSIQETTMNNVVFDQDRNRANSMFIRSNRIEDIVLRSPNIVIIEVDEVTHTLDNCIFTRDGLAITVVHSLKCNMEIGDRLEITSFIGDMEVGERYIIALDNPSAFAAPSSGLHLSRLTSRNSVFPMEYEQQIGEILGIR